MPPLPKPPFTSWPVQVFDARIGFVWYVAPAVIVDQSTIEHATVDAANAIHDWIDRVVEHRREEVRAHGGLLVLHDWRTMRGYDKEARRVFTERMRRREKGYLRRAIVALDVSASPLLKMATQAVNLFSTMTLDAPVLVVETPEDALAEHAITPPRASEPFPG